MAGFEKRVAAARKVVDEGESGRYDEICGEEDEGMGQFLVVEWCDNLAILASTCADMMMVSKVVDGDPTDALVTDISVHDLDQGGKTVGKVQKRIAFRFIPPE